MILFIFILAGLYFQVPPFIYEKYSFTEEYKDLVLNSITNFISDDISYSKNAYVSRDDFENSKVFLKEYNSYQGCDLVEGKVGKTKFNFSQLRVINKRNGENASNEDIFNGIFFKADFNKDFNGKTVLLPNLINKNENQKRQNELIYKMMFGKDRREKQTLMEDVEFSKYFVCFSSDDIKARYILTASLKNKIVAFKNKFPDDQICFSFVDGQMYISISQTYNFFNVTMAQSLLNFNPVKKYYEEILQMIGIVEEFNLNTRIWSKE